MLVAVDAVALAVNAAAVLGPVWFAFVSSDGLSLQDVECSLLQQLPLGDIALHLQDSL